MASFWKRGGGPRILAILAVVVAARLIFRAGGVRQLVSGVRPLVRGIKPEKSAMAKLARPRTYI